MDMFGGGDERVTYTVEIDLAQARQAADEIADIFERRLSQIQIAGPRAGSPAQMAQQMEQTAERVADNYRQIAQVDLTRPVDELRRELETLERVIAGTEDRLEKMAFTAGSFGERNARFGAQVEEYYRQLEFSQGREAANRARARGVVGSIGDITAQFQNDVIPEEEFTTSVQRQAVEKQRQTLDEQREAAELQAAVYEQRLQAIAIERQIATQQLAELDEYMNQIGASGADISDDEAAAYLAEHAQFEQATAKWLEEETDLVESMARARQEAAKIAEQQAARQVTRTERAQQLTGAAPAPQTGSGVAVGRQTAITVTQASADNAERLAGALIEAAQATERIESLRASNAGQRQADLELTRQQAQIERQNARIIEQERQQEITAAQRVRAVEAQANQQKLADIRTTAQAQQQAQRVAATQATQAARATAAQVAQTARSQAEQVIQATRTSAQAQQQATRAAGEVARQQARATAAEQIEQAKRTTAQLKQDLRERERAARQSELAQRRAAGGGFAGSGLIGSLGRNIGYTAAGLAGVYGLDQTLRGGYQLGSEGARALRMAQTFEEVARRVGVSGAAMTAAIEDASRGTINGIESMTIGAQILAQSWAKSSDDVVGDTARLVEASRRLAQLYTDEQGQFLTTQEVFSRLVKFIREGNKELVDQFGISNARIAESLDVTKEGLASSEGAAMRFAGVVQLLTEDLERLGPAALTAADDIEAAEARIREARNRMGQALAEPTAEVAETGANAVERMSIFLFGNRDPRTVARQIQNEAQAVFERNARYANLPARLDPRREARQTQGARLEQLGYGITQANKAVEEGIPGAQEMLDHLMRIADEYYSTGRIADDYASILANVAQWYSQASAAAAEAAAATAGAGEDARATAAELLELADDAREAGAGFNFMAQMVASAGGTLDAFDADLAALEGRLATAQALAAERQSIEQGIGRSIVGAAGNVVGEGLMSPEGAQLMAQDALAALEEAADQWAAQGISDPLTLETLRAQLENELLAPFDSMIEADREREQAAKEAQREWERAAETAKREFEQAAKEAAQAFESALEQVPGLFGTSTVSDEDIADSELGIYVEKADEYLRRLRAEVLDDKNKPDFEGVDIRDAARRIGVSPDLDPEAILRLFERQWASGELFANQTNLDLINREAVLQSFAQQRQAAAGRENIINYFGLDQELANIGGKGLPNDAFGMFAQQMAESIQPAAEQTAPQYVAAMQTSIADEIGSGAYSEQLAGTGAGLLDLIWGGYNEAIPTRPWVGALVDHVSTEVQERLIESLPEA